MKELPILYSGPMVLAIMKGLKTETRRIVKPQPKASPAYSFSQDFHHDKEYSREPGATFAGREVDPLRWWFCDASGPKTAYRCPYGVVGDRLWVRETCKIARSVMGRSYVVYRADDLRVDIQHGVACNEAQHEKWKPSIHMPRWASRLLLEVKDVRVERLQEITTEDIHAEGWPREGPELPAEWFTMLWQRLNVMRGFPWDSNPFVWVVSFRRVE